MMLRWARLLTRAISVGDSADWTNPATAAGVAALQAAVDVVVSNTNLPNNQPVNATVSVQTAATLLRATATKESVVIVNTDAAVTCYIGPATVTAAGANVGLPLYPGGAVAYDLAAGVSLYAIVAAVPVNVLVQRIART